MNCLVSISCITYNHAPYIRQCLDGFLMQKCDFEYEILIHDDASIDGTSDIIWEYQQKYPDMVKPIFQNENQYSKGVRFIGTRFNVPRAKGKYIALCEGDDYWTDPLKLQKQVDFMEANEDYSLTCGAYTSRTDEETVTEKIFEKPNNRKETKHGFTFTMEDNTRVWYTKTLTMLFRKSIYLNAEIDVNRFKYFCDAHLVYFLLKSGNGFYFNQILGCYNVHQGGIFSTTGLGYRYNRTYLIVRELFMYEKSLLNTKIYLKRSYELFLWNLKNLKDFKTTLSLFFIIPMLILRFGFLKITNRH